MTDRQTLVDLIGQRVTVTNPTLPVSWTGRLLGLSDHPSLTVEDEHGRRMTLPQSFRVEPAPPAVEGAAKPGENPAVEFLRVPLKGGGEWVRLDRLSDGRIMCQLCFGYFTRDQLNPVGEDAVEDVCQPCVMLEAAQVLRRAVQAFADELYAAPRRVDACAVQERLLRMVTPMGGPVTIEQARGLRAGCSGAGEEIESRTSGPDCDHDSQVIEHEGAHYWACLKCGENLGRIAEAPAGLVCVCGAPVQRDGNRWVHVPGAPGRPCREVRPRCPHCRLPHDLDGWPAEVCRRVRVYGGVHSDRPDPGEPTELGTEPARANENGGSVGATAPEAPQ